MLKAGIAIVGMLLFLVLMVWIPVSAAGARGRVSGLATPVTVTVRTTPTEDATVTALNKEKLKEDVAQQQHTWDNWLWSNAAAILSSFLSTLVIVIGALFGLWRWRWDRRDAQDKELKDRQNEREKRAEERFQSAVTGLGDEKEGARIGAAILLRTFLRPGYEQFYIQTFDLAVANLRLPRTSDLPKNSDAPQPLTTLSHALIVVFKEAFPLARSLSKGSPQPLDASGIQLDNASLKEADLKHARMPQTSLRKADLSGADLTGADLSRANLSGAKLSKVKLRKVNLSGAKLGRTDLSGANLSEAKLSNVVFFGANLSGADLSGADLSKINLEDVLFLKHTNLHRVKGLTKEQLAACKAKGAIIDEDLTTSSSQSTVTPPLPL